MDRQMTPGSGLTQQEKAVSLFEFVRELNKLKQKLVLDMREYPLCRALSELPDDPEHIQVFFRDREEEEAPDSGQDSLLLSVRKPAFEPCPPPGAELERWLIAGWDSWRQVPMYQSCRFREDPPADSDAALDWFTDHTDLVEDFDRWLARWQLWANRQQILEKTLELFTDLYKRYFELERDPETLELIVATGILMDRENPRLRHPLLTKRVKLCFDPEENVISIREVEGQSELYSVVFQTMDGINLSAVNQLQDDLRRNDYHPLDRNETPVFLKSLIHQLSSDSLFRTGGFPENWKKHGRLLLYTDPCYILRRRLDGTPKAIDRIIENIRETGFVPAPIGDIVSGGTVEIPEEPTEQSIAEQLAAVGGESLDILLSKEANSEQLQIAQRIDRYNAVLVQGPPGTGKTHTIANLMGHFLAQGQSVLVTSHTPKALSVLKDKVPRGLRNLCVSVLEDSSVDMERSIDGIADYMSQATSHELKRDMELLAVERQMVIDQLAHTRQRIFDLIRQECSPIPFAGGTLSPSAAARFVLQGQKTLSWIPGKIDAAAPLPLTLGELAELYRTNEELCPEDERELALPLPRQEELLAPAELEKLLSALSAARDQLRELHSRGSWAVSSADEQLRFSSGQREFTMEQPNRDALQELLHRCAGFSDVQPWMKHAAMDGREDTAYRRRWETLISQIQTTCALSEQVTGETFGHDIALGEGPTDQLAEPLQTLQGLLTEKKRLSKLTLLFHSDCAKVLERIRFDGRALASAGECAVVLHLLELEQARRVCGRYWDELLTPHGVQSFADLDSRSPERAAANWAEVLQRYLNWYVDDFTPLRQCLRAAQIPEQAVFCLSELDSDLAAADKILAAVSADIPAICRLALAELDIRALEDQRRDAKALLQTDGRVASLLCAAAADAIDAADADAYAAACGALERMCAKYALRQRRRELLGRLMLAAPQWAEAIRRRSGQHGQSLLPDTVADAWKWKQLNQILTEILEEPYAKLQSDSLSLSRRYRQITADYAEKRAWYHLMRRTEGDVDMRQALLGWKQTIKRIGKGTGKNAPALKARARALMSRCQEAVPGWIMPMGRALENLDPRRNRFDIIIIDEASQSDVSALAILYMGKKLIIVGDDKQVSPMAVGIEVDKMTALQQMYIQDKIPNSHLYDAKTSIYDIARTTFQPLMLREHFRCVPGIIGFSNRLSYDNQIKPLRDAGSSALVPHLVHHRVPGGVRQEGRKVNHAEAKEIVSLMLGCMAQPEYAGKTFGVISLLGDEQVKRIQQEIEERIDARQIIARKILCGSASHFQGDERDVVFLSMVDSPDERGPLHLQGFGVDDAARKRYNVAASRARDQLWVVTSLDPARDLKPGDIRKTLLDYALAPATGADSQSQGKEAPSEFEADLSGALAARGYHLQLQRSVGAYTLALVATCAGRSVAIECDGEHWHSGESRIREDMERQTILQRLGWQFIRVRGSEYYRSPEKCLERICRELDNLGITPESAAPARPSDLLDRVLTRALSFDQKDGD